MNVVDLMVVTLMAAADVCLIVHLRRRRARYIRMDRITRSLQLHIRGELAADNVVSVPRRRRLQPQIG